jgi:hypothetical protein
MFISGAAPRLVFYGPNVFSIQHPGETSTPQLFYLTRTGEVTSHNDEDDDDDGLSCQLNPGPLEPVQHENRAMTNDDWTLLGFPGGLPDSYEVS